MPINKLAWLGLVLSVLGPAAGVLADQRIRYQDTDGQVKSVALERGDKAWALVVTTPQRKWRNSVLFPLLHPLDGTPLHHIKLVLMAKGFRIDAIYPVGDLIERFQITFENLPAEKAANCPAQISHFRKEQSYKQAHLKQGQMRSALDVDFNEGVARILALEGQPDNTPSLPVGLLSQERSLCALPSVLEFTPLLDLPKVR